MAVTVCVISSMNLLWDRHIKARNISVMLRCVSYRWTLDFRPSEYTEVYGRMTDGVKC